jgi:drug/metabolite transporter (DMT)-like permease
MPPPPESDTCCCGCRRAACMVGVAHGCMAFVVLAFSFWNVLGAWVAKDFCTSGEEIDCPVVVAFYREVGATPVLLIGCAISRGFRRMANCFDVAMLLGAGFCLYGIQLLCILGLAWTNADVVAFYQPAVPVTVVVVAFLIRQETYFCTYRSALRVLGILITVGGIVLLVVDSESKCTDATDTAGAALCAAVKANTTGLCATNMTLPGSADSSVNTSLECCRTCESRSQGATFVGGNVLLALLVLSSALYTIFQKKLMDSPGDVSVVVAVVAAPPGDVGVAASSSCSPSSQTTTSPQIPPRAFRYQAITVLAYCYSVAALCMASTAAVLRPPAHLWAVPGSVVGAVVYAVLVCSVLSYVLMTFSLRYITSTVQSLYGALQPPITALMAWLWTGESVSLYMAIGGLMGMTGLVLTSVFNEDSVHAAHAVAAADAKKKQKAGGGAFGGGGPLVDPLLDEEDRSDTAKARSEHP